MLRRVSYTNSKMDAAFKGQSLYDDEPAAGRDPRPSRHPAPLLDDASLTPALTLKGVQFAVTEKDGGPGAGA